MHQLCESKASGWCQTHAAGEQPANAFGFTGSRELPMNKYAVALAVVGLALCGCRSSDHDARQVTAYVSADRPFSEPIMQEYERRAGVRVNVVYDTEETKSTGLANRLLAEQ